MMVIKFSVYNQRLRRITYGIIPSGSYGKLKFEFDFRTNDWDAVKTKTANFNYSGNNYYVDLDENNQCFVPEEVICATSFIIAVHGGDIVTNNISIPVDGNKEVTPSAYMEIIKLIEEHTHEEYIEHDEIEDILSDGFDAGKIIERS